MTLTEIIGHLSNVENATRIGKGLSDTRRAVRDPYENEARQIAYDTLVSDGAIIPAEIPSAADLPPDQIPIGLQLYQKKENEDASNKLYNSLDAIVSSIPDEQLEKIASVKQIIEKADRKYQDLINHFLSYKSLDALLEKLNSEKVLDPKEEQILRENAAAGKAKLVKESLKSAGYSRDIQDLAAGSAADLIKRGYISDAVLKAGAEKIRDEALNELRKYEGDKKVSVKEYAQETFKKLAKGDAEDFGKALAILYSTK